MESPTHDEKCKIAKRFLSENAATELGRYEFYFRYYDALFGKKPGDNTTPAYSTHGYVVLYFSTLIRHTWQTKEHFSGEFAENVGVQARESAIRALLQASLMIDCASKQNLPEGHKMGDFVNQTWKVHQPFARFVESCFPSGAFQSPEFRKASQTALEQRGRLKAWKLTKHSKVRLRPTDNLAEHLVFDSERRILHVFRHVGFLKAHLYRSRDEAVDLSVGNSLEKYLTPIRAFLSLAGLIFRRGTLPPQLLLEVLDSIQYLLFPNDANSVKSLARFINKYDFDPTAEYYEGHIRTLPHGFEYKYLGDRSAKLLDIVDNPPLGDVVRYLEKHTSPRHNMTIAVLGLFLTALMGFLGVLVGLVALIYNIKQYNITVQALQASPISPTK